MEFNSLVSFLGCDTSNNEIVSSMLSNGIDLLEEAFLDDGQYRAYVERANDGFALVFTDEAYFFGNKNDPIGRGKLFYSGFFLYKQGKDNYSEYKYTLPFGILFSDKREDVIKKLGSESWSRLARGDERVIADRWDDLSDFNYRLHITYDKITGEISILSISMADQKIK